MRKLVQYFFPTVLTPLYCILMRVLHFLSSNFSDASFGMPFQRVNGFIHLMYPSIQKRMSQICLNLDVLYTKLRLDK
jgi:hypothetical protein